MKPNQITAAYLDAIEAGDFERARSFLGDSGFEYRSPLSNYSKADEFIASISHVAAITEGIERRRTFVDGDEVCDILNFKTRMNTLQITPVVQWSRVANDKIVSIEAFFDASEYAQMFDVD